ncbi:helix-turn-helix domain-containing protein [Streptomyces inhibens]|uniref:helix-turn-helix domain-containing protein n=1 Tax=Streptomyces inhibens TaxID=2293571 RepID=UPI00402A8BA0
MRRPRNSSTPCCCWHAGRSTPDPRCRLRARQAPGEPPSVGRHRRGRAATPCERGTTLLHHLPSGRSLRAAGEALHIAPNTVAHRVKQVERLLPTGAEHRPFDLVLTLSLAQDMPSLLRQEPGVPS